MIWEALERVKTLKFKVNGWEALGDMEGDTATYRAEFGRVHYKDSSRDYYLKPGELKQIAKLDWAPPGLAAYLEACNEVLALGKELDTDALIHEDGRHLAHVLAEAGEARLVGILGKRASGWASKCPGGAYATHYAAISCRPDIVGEVVKRCPKGVTDKVDKNGWAAIHYLAKAGGPPSMAKAVDLYGTGPKAKTRKDNGEIPRGSTAIEIAEHFGHHELAAAMKALK